MASYIVSHSFKKISGTSLLICFGFVHVTVALTSVLDGATFRLTHLSDVRQA